MPDNTPPVSDERLEQRAREWVAQNHPSAADTHGADRLVAAFVAGNTRATPQPEARVASGGVEALRDQVAGLIALAGLGTTTGEPRRPHGEWQSDEFAARIMDIIPTHVVDRCFDLADAILNLATPSAEEQAATVGENHMPDARNNIFAGMVPYGLEHPDYPNEPRDWNGGTVLLRDGCPWPGPDYVWKHEPEGDPDGQADVDIIAYTPTQPIAAPAASDGVGEVELAAREAIVLIDEINERAKSRAFYGIDQSLHAKLCTIRATLARRLTALHPHQPVAETGERS
jgi:hypothetical protein